MNFEEKLSDRIDMEDIHEIISLIRHDNKKIDELYPLLFSEDDKIAYQVAWVLTHLPPEENRLLYEKQDELINEALICKHIGKRRLVLALIYNQPLTNPLRVDFLDFCLNRMISKAEPPGIQALCMKIAYELCRPIPELNRELQITLDMMDGELSPAIYVTKKNILKAIAKGKSLQTL